MSIQGKFRVNERIDSKTVRLISREGKQIGVVSIEEALTQARQERLDLVEVAAEAEPPVCKLMDFGKFRYRQSKRQHQGKQHDGRLKAVHFGPKIQEHDIQYRLKQARGFLERRYKVLVFVEFRRLEMRHTEVGEALLERFMTELQDLAKPEKAPQLEGRRMSMILVAR